MLNFFIGQIHLLGQMEYEWSIHAVGIQHLIYILVYIPKNFDMEFAHSNGKFSTTKITNMSADSIKSSFFKNKVEI